MQLTELSRNNTWILILLENNQESKMGFWSFGTHLPMRHFFFKKSYYLPARLYSSTRIDIDIKCTEHCQMIQLEAGFNLFSNCIYMYSYVDTFIWLKQVKLSFIFSSSSINNNYFYKR